MDSQVVVATPPTILIRYDSLIHRHLLHAVECSNDNLVTQAQTVPWFSSLVVGEGVGGVSVCPADNLLLADLLFIF